MAFMGTAQVWHCLSLVSLLTQDHSVVKSSSWDAQVQAMCKRDGIITQALNRLQIYTIKLSKDLINVLRTP